MKDYLMLPGDTRLLRRCASAKTIIDRRKHSAQSARACHRHANRVGGLIVDCHQRESYRSAPALAIRRC